MPGTNVGSPIVTLTPAPTLDRTYFVSNLHSGGVNRADAVGEELAGKGINVSRGLFLAGIEAPGVVPIGNSDPGVLARTGSDGMLLPLWVDGTLRVSTTIVEHNGPTTKVNESPRPLSEQDWNAIVELTERSIPAVATVKVCPTAIIAGIEAATKILFRFQSVRNSAGAMAPKNAITNTKATTTSQSDQKNGS